jgi:nucleoside-diphosphate-sugar epimerase
MNRALVTGGAEFIGGYIVDRLLEDGYEVTRTARWTLEDIDAKKVVTTLVF